MRVHQFFHPRLHGLRVILFFLVAFGSLVVFLTGIKFFTDWLWFKEVGYENVFYITIFTKVKIATLFGVVFFLFLFVNLFLSLRFSSREYIVENDDIIQIPSWRMSDRTLQKLVFFASFFLSLIAGWNSAAQWENFLLFSYGDRFGITDPLFHKDIGFYVFQFPFLRYLYGWVMFGVVFVVLATAVVYFARRSFVLFPPMTWHSTPAARKHLAILLSLLFFFGVFGLWLDLNGILFSKRGVVFGPGYTEVTTQIWVLQALMVVSFLCGVAIISSGFWSNWQILVLSLSVFFLFLFIGRGVYPAVVQKYKVIPNEIVLEMPYLERNILYTRMAYGIHEIEEREFPAEESLTLSDLRNNELTLKNIRLWDHIPLLQTYSQLQEMRTYYKFISVDNDRYTVRGEYRQVMVSPRELYYPNLPSRTWVNEHLIYTHGYGVVMGPVNRVTREGLPEFFIKDIPPVSSTNITVTRPEIYYGEASNEYVFVRTKAEEFDYPVGDQNVYTRYEGRGGVPLSFMRKILFAIRFGSLTILLSNDITSESRIMYYRKISERVSRIVPFIHLDEDPYIVVSPEGNLFWIIDGYTVTDRYPYSEPTPQLGNYIRNSLKAVVDAYHGSVSLYISDPGDPILRTYAKIFPGVFKPINEMPPALKEHIRYPSGMLAIQARMFKAYHMQDPQVFYNKEDLWALPPKHTHGAHGTERPMEPYYTIMRLPGEKKEEFILLVPFTPSKKDNMAAWMAARCDAPHYGKIIVYKFPKQRLVYGPRQIEARIDQDTEISKQLSLWHQRGSQVIRGSLLAIPIERSILYIEPLYLAAEKGQLPELKRVIVAYGNSIAMEENLELSLQSVFGGRAFREKEDVSVSSLIQTPKEGIERQIVREALRHYRRAQEFLKAGDWAGYGNELKRMYETLMTVEQKK